MSLGLHSKAFIEGHLAKGRYQNSSEAIRGGLRLLEEEEDRFVLLSSAIHDGVYSIFANDLVTQNHFIGLKGK